MAKRYSTSNKINDVVKWLLRCGWCVKSTKRHVRIESGDGTMNLTVPKTPSDHRAELNWISQARRIGVDLTAMPV